VTAPMGRRLVGRWRIVAADIGERDFSTSAGRRRSTGFDEMDEVRGSGSAELLEDGSLHIELDRHHGDEAERETSSAAC
jgi:hypothetical protein